MNNNKPLKAAVFLDSRPGHVKQTLGILDALDHLTGVQILEIPIAHLDITEEIFNWLKYFLSSGPAHDHDLGDFDFIIGTGSRTHLPMLMSKRKYHLPVITCMTPSPLLLAHFDLCFVPRHDRVSARKNIFFTNGPPNRARAKGKQKPERGLILIGGKDEKSHHWQDGRIIDAISTLVAKEKDIGWTISSSPRTPRATVSGLEDLAKVTNNATFVKYEETKPGWIENEYDLNQRVWVTADSMSMVYEALSAGCNVGLLPITWKKKDNKFQRCEEQLAKDGYVVTFDQWQQGKQINLSCAAPLNEAQRCAEEIVRRWWIDRLQ